MQTKKERNVVLVEAAMLAINCLAVAFLCFTLYFTTEQIRHHYEARAFLDGVSSIPHNPRQIMFTCLGLLAILLISFLIRKLWGDRSDRLILTTLILDFLVCIMLIFQLDFNYNGLLLLIFANVIAYVKNGKMKITLVILAIVSYLVADYDLLSINLPLYNISDYIRYYNSTVQQYLLSGYNILNSLNVIMFIIYCVYVINEQRDTIEEVNRLYHELQTANYQLQEYADMSERMARTRERNRLAREIHDTLGHTLTGIAVGLDACLALIDRSPELTKKQLVKLSDASREGIKDIRRSVNELRPDSLERFSLDVAIRKMLTDMSQMSDAQIYFDTKERNLKFDEDEENAIYRVIQESITNSVRHGKADRIWITLEKKEGEILLVIKDNGLGCKEIKNGFGTRHIRERIEMLRGSVTFDGKDGFTVTAKIPIRWGEEYD